MNILRPIALATLFALTSLHAQTRQEKIEELFTLTHMDRSLSQLIDQQVEQLKRVVPRMLPDAAFRPAEQQEVDRFITRETTTARDLLDWSHLKPQYIELYATTYTDEEIDGLVAFYRSPVGLAMVAKQTELINRSQAIAQLRLTEIQPTLRVALQAFVKEMETKYPPTRSTATR